MKDSQVLHAVEQNEKKIGPNRGLNPGPLAPKARIIPLDHLADSHESPSIHSLYKLCVATT